MLSGRATYLPEEMGRRRPLPLFPSRTSERLELIFGIRRGRHTTLSSRKRSGNPRVFTGPHTESFFGIFGVIDESVFPVYLRRLPESTNQQWAEAPTDVNFNLSNVNCPDLGGKNVLF